MDDGFRRDVDEVLRQHGEIVRRLTHSGLRGVEELVELYERVRRGIDAITREEIDAMLIRIGSLTDRLRLTGAQLAEIERMRRTLLAGPDAEQFDSEEPNGYVRKHARST